MKKKYFVCAYTGPHGQYEFYEADKCIVHATNREAARYIAGDKFYLEEPYFKYIEIYEFDADDFVEAWVIVSNVPVEAPVLKLTQTLFGVTNFVLL